MSVRHTDKPFYLYIITVIIDALGVLTIVNWSS